MSTEGLGCGYSNIYGEGEMPKRRYFPCKICGKKIDLKTIPDEELMWENEDDGIAHLSCLGENYNVDEWITTDEMRMAVV